MDKQYVALIDHQDKNISWKKGQLVLLDPEVALPYIGVILTPLYSAIKAGLYRPEPPKTDLVSKIIADFSDDLVKPEDRKKKLLQNKLQAQIMAKKAELAKQKS